MASDEVFFGYHYQTMPQIYYFFKNSVNLDQMASDEVFSGYHYQPMPQIHYFFLKKCESRSDGF